MSQSRLKIEWSDPAFHTLLAVAYPELLETLEGNWSRPDPYDPRRAKWELGSWVQYRLQLRGLDRIARFRVVEV